MNGYIKNNIDNSLSYFKYVLNLRRSKIAYIILCLAIIPRVIWMTKDVIPNEIIFQADLNQSINDFAEMLSLFKLNFIKVLSITWIFIVISIFEFSKSHNLRKLSLARIYHSNNPKHFNKNFGRVLCIWDKLFGTYMDESHLNEIKSFGVNNSDYNKFNPFFSYYILPLKKLFTKIRKLFYPILFNS